jgi:hypothetical protein
MKPRLLSALVLAACVLPTACDRAPTGPVPAERPSLITNGVLAGDRYPAVVLVVMDVNARPTYTCSGTLLSPTVVLTAGHCTGEPNEFTGIRIFPASDLRAYDAEVSFREGFKKGAPGSIEASAWAAHPLYTSAAFFRHDVGAIRLSSPVTLAAGQHYGTLPAVDQLESLRPRASTRFTAVGYGLQRVNANPNYKQYQGDLVRMVAEPHLLQINTGFTGGFSLLLSNNAASGGTCFGDSGGPNYLGATNVIAGVTSFGLNGSCGGTGGVFRLDRKDVLDFVGQYLTK